MTDYYDPGTYERAVSTNSADAQRWMAHWGVAYRQGDYDTAFDHLRRSDTLSRAPQHPDNVWALHGLHECLVLRGDTVDAGSIKKRLDMAADRADVPREASCFCRLEPASV